MISRSAWLASFGGPASSTSFRDGAQGALTPLGGYEVASVA